MHFQYRRTAIPFPIAGLIVGGVLLAGLHGCGGGDHPSSWPMGFANPPATTPPAAAASVSLTTVSARPAMVSGGDVVVSATSPAGALAAGTTFQLNGVDVTDKMVFDATTKTTNGLLTGLALGSNVLTAVSAGQEVGRLEMKNFPASGPIFSGKRQSPWICETQASGLGAPPASGPCVAAVQYSWFYRTTAGTFAPLASLAAPYPADLATTVTTEGKTVNYIVRVESGTIDESIYRIAVIDDPANPIRDPWRKGGKKPGDGWNGKLAYPFVGGADPGFRSGSNLVTSALQDLPLSLGFAVAFGTRNTYGNGFDDVTSAETLMMVKERFIEQYGLPKFTVGSGGSGGAVQQHHIAQNYPGLLDALTPSYSFPDIGSIAQSAIDCSPLNNYFDHLAADPAAWTSLRRSTVDGGAVADAGPSIGKTVCQNNYLGYIPALYSPNPVTFSPVVPVALRYDPVTNVTGARGGLWDGNINSLGMDPKTGFARSFYDNAGLQYGLQALNAGKITPEEFVDINEKVGGIDIDGNLTTTRVRGDAIGVSRAYASGRVVTNFDNMTIPIIDFRAYSDNLGDIHARDRTLSFLQRLQNARGTTANQVSWTARGTGVPDFDRMALLALNDWLVAVQADASQAPLAEKVIRNKPASLKDACWVDGVKIEEPISWDPATACNKAIPIHQNPRTAAGAPLADDVLMCKLKPIDFASYAVTFSSAQKGRLRAAFPQGVCDWSMRGEVQPPLSGTWIDYGSGPFGPANVYQ
jgi:hypothetical protein